MGSSIFGIGQSALAAAQAGISTTGHNIANANTAGYSRQEIVQSTAMPQQYGNGFFGQGVQVTTVKRIYNDVLAKQALDVQSSSNSINTYASKMSQIDSMLSDADAGLTPALKDFFAGISKLSANPGDTPTRQTVISTAQALASRFQSLGGQLAEMQNQINTQIPTTVSSINTYATQISKLNDAIEKAYNSTGQPPNDLLDQRDELVYELGKQVKTTTVAQGNTLNVFIGNGLPIVVGNSSYSLTAVNSVSDASRMEVAYKGQSQTTQLGTNSITGGVLGGLLQFREQSLDSAQNQLGQIGMVLTSTFNAQHISGKDLSGTTGTNFFGTNAVPVSVANSNNTGSASLNTTVSSATALTSSNYNLKYDGTNYIVTRLNDNTQVSSTSSLPQTVDGLTFAIGSGTMASGDSFLIKPTINGATAFSVVITDTSKIAAAAASATTASVKGDGSNSLLLEALQNKSYVNTGSTTVSYSSAFSQLVSTVGVKTNELNVTGAAEDTLLSQVTAEQQSTSGVNLDEEAANLMRYQQAYQAAGKLMQMANQLFSVLLNISG